jgi:hypothetical protein
MIAFGLLKIYSRSNNDDYSLNNKIAISRIILAERGRMKMIKELGDLQLVRFPGWNVTAQFIG